MILLIIVVVSSVKREILKYFVIDYMCYEILFWVEIF